MASMDALPAFSMMAEMAISSNTTTTTTTTVEIYLDNSVESVQAAVKINLFLFVFFLLVFDALVYIPRARRFLLPRWRDGDPLPGFPLGWLRQVFKSESRVDNIDRDVVIRFCQLGFKFSALGSVLDIGLLPLYAMGNGDAEGFNVYSLSNLRIGSESFWGVIVAAYILTGALTRFLLTEWRLFVLRRREHFSRCCLGEYGSELAQARRSVIVETIPLEYQSSEKVRSFFEDLFGSGSVYSCVLQDDLTNVYLNKCCGCWPSQLGDVVNVIRRDIDGEIGSLPMATNRIAPEEGASNAVNRVDRALLATAGELGQGARNLGVGVFQLAQGAIVGNASSSTALVTFNNAVDCAKATQLLLECGDETHVGVWQVRAAPEPRDMIWRNSFKSLAQNRLRNSISTVGLTFLLIGWAGPILAVQAFAQADSLQQQFPSLIEHLQKYPFAYSIITAYLPAMALIGLQAILPPFFDCLARYYEGTKSESEVEKSVLGRCFAYNLASLYVTVCAGSVFSALETILQNPQEVFKILSGKLPGVSVYFITFVLAKVGTTLPLWALLRPTAACSGDAPQVYAYGYELANLSLVLVLGLTYSFIAPAILPACALFFGLAALVYRWLFEHVYEQQFDSGGVMWYSLFNCVMIGFLTGTLALVAIALVRATKLQISLLAPLPMLVIYFYFYCWRQLGTESQRVALKDAMKIDERFAQQMNNSPQPVHFSEVAYEDPILRPNSEVGGRAGEQEPTFLSSFRSRSESDRV